MNLNRDFLKTLGGILIIGAIVVATFLIGNQQRQDQIRKEEAAKEESAKKTTPVASAPKTQNYNQPSTKQPSNTKGVGGGTIPQTGGGVWFLMIPAAGVGFAEWKITRRRKQYSF